MKASLYNQTGEQSGTIELPDAVFNAPWNADLVHQVVISMQSNARHNTAHAKDRSDVRGGGKKPWKQKGTGRARHGSIRSPLWRGGGVTFGPLNERNYKKKINKKMRAKALYSVLSEKLRRGEVMFLQTLEMDTIKTKQAKNILNNFKAISRKKNLLKKKRNAYYITLPESNPAVSKSFRNFGNVSVALVRNLNPVEILSNSHLIIANPEKSVPILEARMEKTQNAKRKTQN